MQEGGKFKIVVVLALVVALGILVYFYFGKRAAGPEGPQPVYAPEGSLVQGFPPELVLDADARLGRNYSVNYAQNLNQYTAEFASEKAMSSLFSEYKNYFKENGWNITNEITKYSGSRGLYAKRPGGEASVAIIAQGGGSQVVVSYLAK